MLEASICMSTHNKPHLLEKTLESIYAQSVPFEFETIVVDDGSKDGQVREICGRFPVRYHRIDREPVFRNPCVARNVAYRMARADIIIAQSDEVVHKTPDAIERLVRDLQPGTMLFANVFCENKEGNRDGVYTGPGRRAPYFFLGSLFREDLYAIGGNDEEINICPAWEDQWFADCLIRGRKLQPVFSTDIIGHHLWHEYCTTPETEGPSRELYKRKLNGALFEGEPWWSTGGPWPYVGLSRERPEEPTQETFSRIYQTKHWGDGESKSGGGSSVEATRVVRDELPRILAQRKVKTLLDLPCGDFNWMQHTRIPWINYLGGDIVPELIEDLRARFTDGKRTFFHLDLLCSDLPKADMILCRDCLQHLSYGDFRKAVANIRRSGATYLLATTFPNHFDNRAINTGDWCPYNLQEPPFHFPQPIELLNEDCQEWYPHFSDKSLGLWRVADLPTSSEPIKSLVVCVEYDDFLAITLPRNTKHFHRTLVVTSPRDTKTQDLAERCGVECYVTDAFYRNGAAFNKGAAVEEAFDVLGRDGWICIWDADIVMPESIEIDREPDCLYTPARHLLEDPASFRDELDWSALPSPTQPHEFDGYFQLFHASAVEPPWYGTDWTHAGGCDSDFQFRFPVEKRRRAPFKVLHLGTEGMDGTRIGRNWRGRVAPRIDTGEAPDDAGDREVGMKQMLEDRGRYGTAKEKVLPRITGEIPRRMSFFWHGRMSWMRYLTLQTFRDHNPDWEIRLYVPAAELGRKTWKTPEEDGGTYSGTDYREQITKLRIDVIPFRPPVNGVAPAHASDLLAWHVLSTDGGFCADMDILWLRSIEDAWKKTADADAVFCLEDGMLAIGLLAARPNCPVFASVLAIASAVTPGGYQCFGTEALYRTFPPIRPGREPIGVRTIEEMRRRYGSTNIRVLPDETVYPFDWRQIDQIFGQTAAIPADCVGLHWFGGSSQATEWNNRLTPDNWREWQNTFTNCLRGHI